MLEYLIQLPYETMGQNMLGYLELIDIIQFEKAASLIALSERGLPLEELDIPWIPIRSAEIAAQCAHALSRIPELLSYYMISLINRYRHAIQYMTGLRRLYLDCTEDHLLMPHLSLQGHCSSIKIDAYSSITPQQLCKLVIGCPQLHTFDIKHSTCISDAVLVELARSCPHLQKVTLWSSEVTEKGVLALAAHCTQLQKLDISYITLTEETVRQLAQHCPHLTSLYCGIPETVRFSHTQLIELRL